MELTLNNQSEVRDKPKNRSNQSKSDSSPTLGRASFITTAIVLVVISIFSVGLCRYASVSIFCIGGEATFESSPLPISSTETHQLHLSTTSNSCFCGRWNRHGSCYGRFLLCLLCLWWYGSSCISWWLRYEYFRSVSIRSTTKPPTGSSTTKSVPRQPSANEVTSVPKKGSKKTEKPSKKKKQ